VVIDIDRDTGVMRAVGTPCPATATRWGASDLAEVSTPDLMAELLALPDGPAKALALAAVPQIAAGLVAVFAALLSGRS
jgi:hypothetical protein